MQKEENPSRFDVSVILPMAYHQGLAVECIEGWAKTLSYPRDRYQIVVAAPQSLDAGIVEKLRKYLQPWDRLECYPFNHDIPLVAVAAKLAESEWLLFTESHCVPEPHALTHLMESVAAHPEWAGICSVTAPLTDNLLSKLAAGIYARDIRDKPVQREWLKAVDQCFLVRKNIYFACGGFEPEYEYFSKRLLSASLHHAGHHVEFDFTPVVRHAYSGRLTDLEDYTLNFAHGEIKFAAQGMDDARADYFPPVPELQELRGRTSADFLEMARLRFAALPALIRRRLSRRNSSTDGTSLWRLMEDLFGWLLKGFKGTGGGYLGACLAEIFARLRLKNVIRRFEPRAAQAAYVDWLGMLVHKGRLHYLARSGAMIPAVRNPNFSHSGGWRVGDHGDGVELLGFHDQETLADRAFCWSMHSACVYIPLHQGCHHITLEWEPVRPMQAEDFIRVEFDGHRIPIEKLSLSRTSLAVEVTSDSKGWHRFSWSVIPFAAAGDRRLLGLPLSRICWSADDARLAA